VLEARHPSLVLELVVDLRCAALVYLFVALICLLCVFVCCPCLFVVIVCLFVLDALLCVGNNSSFLSHTKVWKRKM
jgi:hypothetical protein